MEKVAVPMMEIYKMVSGLKDARTLLNNCLNEGRMVVSKKSFKVLKRKTRDMVFQINMAIIKLSKLQVVKAKPDEWQQLQEFYSEVMKECETLRPKLESFREKNN